MTSHSRPRCAFLAGAFIAAFTSTLPAAENAKPEPRPFRMGFTGFVHALTAEAMTETTDFCRRHGDLIAHHIEGAAWAEMHAGQPLPEEMLKKWSEKRARKPDGGKVFLALSPGRGELKIAEKCAPLPDALKFKTYDDPAAAAAYLAYCERAIEYFQPDWLVIGIEMNEIIKSNSAAWQAYVRLHEKTYQALKKKHPKLPIAASCSLHNLFKGGDAMFAEWQRLDAWNDFVAVSYYPFLAPSRTEPVDWLLAKTGKSKPVAFVETNDSGEPLPMPQAKVTIPGSPENQVEYYRFLFARAQEHRFEFIVSFIHRDYDTLWEAIKDSAPEIFKAWRDCGFLDENGKARPSLALWDEWFARPWRR
jgi:hypothetical protein